MIVAPEAGAHWWVSAHLEATQAECFFAQLLANDRIIAFQVYQQEVFGLIEEQTAEVSVFEHQGVSDRLIDALDAELTQIFDDDRVSPAHKSSSILIAWSRAS